MGSAEHPEKPTHEPLLRRAWVRLAGLAVFLGVGGIIGNELWGWFEPNVLDTERLTVRVELDPRTYEGTDRNWESHEWVFPAMRRSSLAAPPSDICRERWPWARRWRGIDAQLTRARVYVTGDGLEEVLLDRAQVVVEKRQRPLNGTHARCPVGGASASPRGITVALDARDPHVQYQETGGGPSRPFAFKFPEGQKETEIFDIVGFAERCYCTWKIDLIFTIEGERKVVSVPSEGQRFQTTGITAARPACWNGKRWRPAPLSSAPPRACLASSAG